MPLDLWFAGPTYTPSDPFWVRCHLHRTDKHLLPHLPLYLLPSALNALPRGTACHCCLAAQHTAPHRGAARCCAAAPLWQQPARLCILPLYLRLLLWRAARCRRMAALLPIA